MYVNDKKHPLIGFLALVLLIGCNDIIQDDISKRGVVLEAPKDGLQTTNQTLTFLWEDVEGASEYRFQVGRPSFENLQEFLVDSMVDEGKFTHTFQPGDYEWRVRGVNNASRTKYYSRSFSVDSTSDISGIQVVLKNPQGGLVSSDTSFTFEWYAVSGAEFYEFRIEDMNGNLLFPEEEVEETFLYKEGIYDGKYVWGVRGVNNTSNTYTDRSKDTLIVDTSKPGKPSLTSPSDGAMVPDSVQTLQWNRVSDNGTSLHDSLYVASDSLMNNLVKTVKTTQQSFSDSLGPGTYYWKVRTLDEADNRSPYSDKWKFIVQ